MAAETLDIDPDEAISAASTITAAASHGDSAATDVRRGSAPGERGFAFTDEVGMATSQWHSALGEFANTVSTTGANVSSAAGAVTAADTTTRAGISASMPVAASPDGGHA